MKYNSPADIYTFFVLKYSQLNFCKLDFFYTFLRIDNYVIYDIFFKFSVHICFLRTFHKNCNLIHSLDYIISIRLIQIVIKRLISNAWELFYMLCNKRFIILIDHQIVNHQVSRVYFYNIQVECYALIHLFSKYMSKQQNQIRY